MRAAIEELCEALGAGRSAPPIETWLRFAALVEVWNARLNLTGARDPRALAEVLFADALVLSEPRWLPDSARFVDVGAGAGAPAIPLLALRPDLRATLIEPLRKRVAFLRSASGTLDLVDRCRIDERKLDDRPVAGAPFDVAVSRATFAPDEWLRRAAPLSDRVIVLVAADPLPELPSATLLEERRYELPFSGAPRGVGLYALG